MMEEYIQTYGYSSVKSDIIMQMLAVLFVNQSFLVGKMFLQILRHHQRASNNQYEHSYIY